MFTLSQIQQTNKLNFKAMNGLTEKLNYLKLVNKKPTILVVGDLMIDQYIWGSASRLSPEAPVPVVAISSETYTLGGAGNVVQNLVSLGANLIVSGVIGNDLPASRIIDILIGEGVNTEHILRDNERDTTVKTRVVVGSHQLVRIDKECTHAVSASMENELMDHLSSCMQEADLVVMSDYNKGLLSPGLTRGIIDLANKLGKKVIVDPKGHSFQKYQGAYIIKPNRQELALATKSTQITSIESLKLAAEIVLEQTNAQYLIVTLSEEGLMIFDADSYRSHPVKATEVFDVTGAGDTVIASIAYFSSLGLDLDEACELANHAAAIVIRRVGSVTTTVDEIIQDIVETQKRNYQELR
jgi:D-beta-D-heptose 7-phosphate kinase/D-beta-D-heptose 1-phosphate adenosyltransferase